MGEEINDIEERKEKEGKELTTEKQGRKDRKRGGRMESEREKKRERGNLKERKKVGEGGRKGKRGIEKERWSWGTKEEGEEKREEKVV